MRYEEERDSKKRVERQKFLKIRKQAMKDLFHMTEDQRKENLTQAEAFEKDQPRRKQLRDDELMKYLAKEKEIRKINDEQKQIYDTFYGSGSIKTTFQNHFEDISSAFIKYARKVKYLGKSKKETEEFTISNNQFLKLASKLNITPNLVSKNDLNHIFKMIVRDT